MKTNKLAFGLLLLTITAAALPAGAQTDKVETKTERDARMAWWREAKFGMFIHWGVYSVPAGFYHDKPVPGIGEWIMNRGKIPMAEYQSFARQFNPAKFNAEQWVKIAKDAGQKYIVITSKHHDGFAMFDSKASDWNIMKATPFGRDPLKELAAACQKEGIKLGFYYSQAQDWNNGGAASGGKWDPAQQHDMDDYIDKVAVPQVEEILTHYKPFPAVLWWDTPNNMNPEREQKLYDTVQKLRPDIIMNNRLGGRFKGDTETPEQTIPAQGFPGRDWETCMTMNDTWGYKRDDTNFKSTATLIRNLCDIASKGGNYLLNVGPTSEGLIPQPEVDRLKEVGAWMKVNGEAIYGTSPTIFGAEAGSFSATQTNRQGRPTFIPAWDWRCTTKAGKIYVHIFKWPAGQIELPGVKGQVTAAWLLAGAKSRPPKIQPGEHAGFLMVKAAAGGEPHLLKLQQTAQAVTVQLPEKAPAAIASVLCLQVKGEVAAAAPLENKQP
ncbi:MAG: alpha-L-fucosidase [Verrucomicrobiota bacterium]